MIKKYEPPYLEFSVPKENQISNYSVRRNDKLNDFFNTKEEYLIQLKKKYSTELKYIITKGKRFPNCCEIHKQLANHQDYNVYNFKNFGTDVVDNIIYVCDEIINHINENGTKNNEIITFFKKLISEKIQEFGYVENSSPFLLYEFLNECKNILFEQRFNDKIKETITLYLENEIQDIYKSNESFNYYKKYSGVLEFNLIQKIDCTIIKPDLTKPIKPFKSNKKGYLQITSLFAIGAIKVIKGEIYKHQKETFTSARDLARYLKSNSICEEQYNILPYITANRLGKNEVEKNIFTKKSILKNTYSYCTKNNLKVTDEFEKEYQKVIGSPII